MSNQINLKRHIPTLLTVLGLIVSGYIIWIWNQQFEVIDYSQIKENAKPKINELYAAEVFSTKLQHAAESLSSANYLIDHLPEKRDLILYANSNERLSNTIRREALMNWVKSGGLLLINADENLERDPLLTDLGVHKLLIQDYLEDQGSDEETTDDEAAEDSESEQRTIPETTATELNDDTKQCKPTPEYRTNVPSWGHGESVCSLINVKSALLAQPTDIHFCTDYYLHDDSEKATPLAMDEWGLPHMLQYEIGEGKIIVLEDYQFLTNSRILYFDHAYFLAQLLQDRNKLWLLYQGQSESLMQFLWKHAKLAISLFVLLIGFYLWRNMLRFGPIIFSPAPERRQLIEHLQASARFKWKNEKTHPEISAIQQEILQAAARKQGRQRIDFEQELSWLAQNSTLSEAEIRARLTQTPPSDPLELLTLTQILFQLRTLL